jgi:hypothetical protein
MTLRFGKRTNRITHEILTFENEKKLNVNISGLTPPIRCRRRGRRLKGLRSNTVVISV